MSKILIVEDDVKIREELKLFLVRNGYEVKLIEDFSNTLEDIIKSNCELILLDVNIPGVSGEYLCKNIRKISDVPIIIVTSRNNEIDELISINYGADDYITKPYNPQILLARMESVLKRTNKNIDTIIYRGIKVNMSRSCIECSDNIIELTKNELKIFSLLLDKKGTIVSRDELMDYLWDSHLFVDDNTLTVNINRLRNKLDNIGLKDCIETKRGLGYILL